MAMDFPNSPSVGDTHRPAGSPFLYQWDGVAWVIPVSPEYDIYRGVRMEADYGSVGTYEVPAGGVLTLVLDNVIANVGGFYNPNTGLWTPPAGNYIINAVVGLDPAGAESLVRIVLLEGGVETRQGDQQRPTGTNRVSVSGTWIVTTDGTKTLGIAARVSGAVPVGVSNNNNTTWMQGHRLGLPS